MSKKIVLKASILSLAFAFLFFILLTIFYFTENSILSLFIIFISVLGVVLGIKGVVVSKKRLNKKEISKKRFLLNIFLNLLFPLILTLLLLANISDLIWLFSF